GSRQRSLERVWGDDNSERHGLLLQRPNSNEAIAACASARQLPPGATVLRETRQMVGAPAHYPKSAVSRRALDRNVLEFAS
ncbi:hypothetical protein, partial [Salinibacterium sp.]|uniref:hypothetical protein n=1 Tax=Salinibacterium sp. TaxID=1915057 RepID=UPI00286A4263